MPQPHQRRVEHQVLVELVEADVATGFSLVDVALAQSCRGELAFSAQALQHADATVADIERRLAQLGPQESAPFHALVDELRREIAAARA